MEKYPKCFISYSWETQDHKDWVRFLAENLQANGVYTFLDQWDMSLGDQIPQFMETAIRQADYVLLICTPIFATKANASKGGVGYEKNIVTGEMFVDSISNKKFVAILRRGSPSSALPSYLKSKVFLDFRDDNKFAKTFEELLRHFFSEPKYTRPQLGEKPKFNEQVIERITNRPETILKNGRSRKREATDLLSEIYKRLIAGAIWAIAGVFIGLFSNYIIADIAHYASQDELTLWAGVPALITGLIVGLDLKTSRTVLVSASLLTILLILGDGVYRSNLFDESFFDPVAFPYYLASGLGVGSLICALIIKAIKFLDSQKKDAMPFS